MRVRALTLVVALSGGLTYLFLCACGDQPPSDAARRTPAVYDADGGRPDSTPDAGPYPNLIVIVVDTLRADAVALPDQPPASMPFFADLAARGVSFRRAISPSAWTEPAMASLLTGLLPREHGCVESGRIPRLPPSIATYAEVLQRSYGYETAAFTDATWHRTRPWSILQGFARGSNSVGFTQLDKRPMERGYWLDGTEQVLDDWLRARNAAQPFCLLMHTFDAHDPYGEKNRPARDNVEQAEAAFDKAVATFDIASVKNARDATRQFLTHRPGRTRLFRERGRRFAQEIAQYLDGGFSLEADRTFAREMEHAYRQSTTWVDTGLRRAVAALEARGLLENTLLVVTSDHGEAFGEHGTLGHGHHLHAELTHVPMVMLGPNVFKGPRIVDRTVGLLDVFPTFFDWAGLGMPSGVRGQSVLPAVRDAHSDRIVASETMVTADMAGPGERRLWISRRSDAWTFLMSYDIARGTVVEKLFRAEDVREEDDLAVDGIARAEFSDAFCEEIDAARDVLWNEVHGANGRAGTVYGAGIETVRMARPAPCGR